MKLIIAIITALIFSSCFFFGPSPKNRLRKLETTAPIDVVIVPGLPLYHGKLDTLLKSRILWSEYLYRKGFVTNILYSGNAVYSPWLEGPSMALFAEQLGIPKEHIVIDTLAEHSTENLYYSYHQAKKLGYKTIAVATDPFQCAMLHKFAKNNFKEKIYFIPIVYDSIRTKMNLYLEIDTNLTKKINFIHLAERENYKQRLRGTRGKKIQQ